MCILVGFHITSRCVPIEIFCHHLFLGRSLVSGPLFSLTPKDTLLSTGLNGSY